MKARLIMAGACAVIASIVPPAHAQQQPPPAQIPPVEVVATRVPKGTHEVPASVEIVSGADLRARGATTLKDALSLATGVAIAPGGDAGPASSVPEFWGLREFDAFLLVVDGVPWGGALNPAVASLNLRDVDHIEVLRGPAPVTYGATSFVGVISVVHNSAAETSRTIGAQGGSYGSGGASIDMGLPLGSWSSRLSADYDKTGFKDDRTSASKGNGLWRLSKTNGDRKTWATAGVNIIRQDPASPVPRDGASLSTATPLDANYNPDGAYLNENRLAFSAGHERPLFGGAWGSILSYTHAEQNMFRGFLTDISNSANNASGFLENIELNDVYADSHIIWPVRNRWQFMAGADALYAKGEAKGATFTYTAPLDATSAPSVPQPTTLDKDSENERIFLGAYGSAEWRPVSRLTLDGGVRLNRTSEKRGEDNPSADNTKLSGSVGALYGLWEQGENHVRAFANFRSTFKPAAFDFGLVENEGILKPETSRSYEGGLKIECMDGKASLEGELLRHGLPEPRNGRDRQQPADARQRGQDAVQRIRTRGRRATRAQRVCARDVQRARRQVRRLREGLRRRHAHAARGQARGNVGEESRVGRSRLLTGARFLRQRHDELHRRPLSQHAQHGACAGVHDGRRRHRLSSGSRRNAHRRTQLGRPARRGRGE